MRKYNVVLIALVFAIMMVTLVINSNSVFASNKTGPTPIPGNLFPHPDALHHDHVFKHASEKSHEAKVIPST